MIERNYESLPNNVECISTCSVEYWFRCMDLDGDGVLSMYELEYFYVEQLERMEALGIETLPFEDCLCQVRASSRAWFITSERPAQNHRLTLQTSSSKASCSESSHMFYHYAQSPVTMALNTLVLKRSELIGNAGTLFKRFGESLVNKTAKTSVGFELVTYWLRVQHTVVPHTDCAVCPISNLTLSRLRFVTVSGKYTSFSQANLYYYNIFFLLFNILIFSV